MSTFVWWCLFIFLIFLLVVISVRLCHRVLSDIWCSEESPRRSDFEDHKRYQTDSRTVFKNITLESDSDKPVIQKLLPNALKQEQNIPEIKVEEVDEMVERNHAKTPDDAIDAKEENDSKEEEKIKKSTTEKKSQETDDLSEEEKTILEQIQGIQGEVDIYAKQIPYCLGGKQHLQYFEINQNFLMNLISLSSIDCKENDKLKKRKQMVSMYIQECQNELKKKAEEYV